MKLVKKFLSLLVIFFIVTELFTPLKVYADIKPAISRKSLTLYLNNNFSEAVSYYFLKVANVTSRPSWSISDKTIASVSKNGTVIAKNVGKTIITAKVGSTILKCNLTVKKEPDKSFLKKKVTVKQKIENGYVQLNIKNNYDDMLFIDLAYKEYDKGGTKIGDNRYYTYVAGNDTNIEYSKLSEKTKYVDIVINEVRLINKHQEEEKFISYEGVYDVFKLTAVKVKMNNIELKDNGSNKGYSCNLKITNNTDFDIDECHFMLRFYKNNKVIFTTKNYVNRLKAHTTTSSEEDTTFFYSDYSFKDGMMDYDKYEIVPLYGRNYLTSND